LDIALQYKGLVRHSDLHHVEFFLAVLLRVCRAVTGQNLTPARVLLSHIRSDGLADYTAFFGREVAFQAERDGMVFTKEHQHLPVTGADAYLNQMLVRICEETLSTRRTRPPSLRTSVENIAAPILPHGKPLLNEVAKQLHMSERTLARRLALEGVSFAGIIEEMRRNLALRYLQDRSLTVSRIAWLLGYQEVAAFTHAFRRWTGRAPSEHRTALKANLYQS
jgi:AraC-like DNA-binding protein